MRFEAKNKVCKQDAQRSNFKNVCKTVAEQHQQRHCIKLRDLFCKNPVDIQARKLLCIHTYYYVSAFAKTQLYELGPFYKPTTLCYQS